MNYIQETTIDKIDIPQRLYKYRKWNKPDHKKILTENTIFFSPPLDCDEQHECNLPRDYYSVSKDMLFKYYYQNAPAQGYIIESERIAVATKLSKEGPFFDIKHRSKNEKKFRDELNQRLSIFCACAHKDNFNLWSSFANGQQGFCVGFDPYIMFENEQTLGGGGLVNYFPLNHPPTVKPFHFNDEERIADFTKVIMNLPDMYSNEKEYRLFKLDIKENEVIIPKASIKEIILGAYISTKNKREIISIAKDKFPDALLLQANYNEEDENYDFETITG